MWLDVPVVLVQLRWHDQLTCQVGIRNFLSALLVAILHPVVPEAARCYGHTTLLSVHNASPEAALLEPWRVLQIILTWSTCA
jgi:hypothetical protein